GAGGAPRRLDPLLAERGLPGPARGHRPEAPTGERDPGRPRDPGLRHGGRHERPHANVPGRPRSRARGHPPPPLLLHLLPPQPPLPGRRPVSLRADPERGHLPAVEALQAAVTPRTRAILVNSPANPTGAVFPRDLLHAIAELVVRHDLLLVSDEAYEALVYGD